MSFWRANSRGDGEHRFVVTSQGGTAIPFLLRSYDKPHSPSPTIQSTIWEAARATMASSIFFGGVRVEAKDSIVDFGTADFYNPVGTVYREARILWPERNFILVSIGAGAAPRNKFSGRLGANIESVEKISALAEAADHAFELQQTGTSMKTSYYRFSAGNLADIGLVELHPGADVEAATHSYLKMTEMQDSLRHCVRDLSKINYEGSFYLPALILSIKLMLIQKNRTPLSIGSYCKLVNSKFESLLNG